MWERTGLTEKKQVKRILNMNIVQLKLKNASVEQNPLFDGKTKKTSAKNVKYILSNNNVFIENHEYFGVFTKKYFREFHKALTNQQRLEFWLFINNLTNGIKMKISEVRFTPKERISFVEVTTTHEGKDVKFEMFYFRGLHKLLSFASFVKYDLNLKKLMIIATQK